MKPSLVRTPATIPMLTLTLLLAACGQSPDLPATTDPTPPSTHSPTPQPEPVTAGLSWSDPATWQKLGQSVPVDGATVTIPAGLTVLLDVDTPDLKGLHVNGQLHLAEQFTDTNGNDQLDVRAGFVMVHGELRAGSEGDPYGAKATFTLTGSENVDVTGMNMGAKVLGVMGGRLELHGTPLTPWVRLAATVPAGGSSLTLDRDVNWRVGDRIIVTATDHARGTWENDTIDDASKHTEVATVSAISGRTVTLAAPLKYQHWGTVQNVQGFTVDQRAEVALLTRDIKIQGDEGSAASLFGGHTMIMGSGRARLHHVEFERMGQGGIMGRYPVHFHMQGEQHLQADGVGNELVGSSVHHAFNRFMSIHGTDRVQVQGNVGYNTFGHGFFLEDGAERFNVFVGNLGVLAREVPQDRRLLPSDRHASVFWISNPENVVRNNVAVNAEENGFHYETPTTPTGLSAGRTDIKPNVAPLLEFSGNRAHSNGGSGLFVDGPDGGYKPAEHAIFRDFQSHHDGAALWLGGDRLIVDGFVFSDQRGHTTHRGGSSWVRDGVWFGQTGNAPKTGVVLGTATYGGRTGLENVTFVNFPTTTGSAAIELEEHNELVQDKDYLRNLRFVNANPVWMTVGPPTERGYQAQAFRDRTGTITGTPGVSLVPTHAAINLTQNCTLRDAWNAYVCNERYRQLWLRPNDGSKLEPLSIVRDDGVTQAGSQNSFPLISGRRYTLSTTGEIPTWYQEVGIGENEPNDVFRLALPLAQAPTFVGLRYHGHLFKTAAGSLAEVEADPNRYYYDPAAKLLHLKLVPLDDPNLHAGWQIR